MDKGDAGLGEGCHLHVGRPLPSFKWNQLALLCCMHALPGDVSVAAEQELCSGKPCEQVWRGGVACGEAQTWGHGVLSLGDRSQGEQQLELDSERRRCLELLSLTAEGLPPDMAPGTM